ncbi:Rhodanese domain-containing protein [Entamoeba marina]
MATSFEDLIQNSIDNKDVSVVKELCKISSIPPQLRNSTYELILNPHKQQLSKDPIDTDQFLPLFTPHYTSNLSDTMHRLGKILANVNENTTPLANICLPLLSLDLEDEIVVGILNYIISTHIPLIKFDDQTIKNGIVILFSLLLQYHDPELSLRLSELRVDLSSFVYERITSLCFQLFGSIQGQLQLFDQLILSSDQLLHIYFLLAHILLLKQSLLNATTSDSIISILETPLNEEKISFLSAYAKGLIGNTPVTITKQMYACMTNSVQYQRWVYSTISTAGVAVVSPKDIMSDKRTRNFQLFFIDGRTHEIYLGGSLPGSLNIDTLEFQKDPEKLSKVFDELSSLKTTQTHIIVFGNADHRDQNEQTQQLMMWLIKSGFKHVSELHNGYSGYHYLFDNEKGFDIDHHSLAACPVCRKAGAESVTNLIKNAETVGTKAFEFAKGWFGSTLASMSIPEQNNKEKVHEAKEKTPNTTIVESEEISGKVIEKKEPEEIHDVKEQVNEPEEIKEISEEKIEKKIEEKKEGKDSEYYEELMKTELNMKGEIIADTKTKVTVIATNREMILLQGDVGSYVLFKKIPLMLLKKVSMKKATPDVLTFNGNPPHLPLTIRFEKVQQFLQFLKSKSSKKDTKKSEKTSN